MIKLNGQPINITHFPDGTTQVWKLQDVILQEADNAKYDWWFESEAEVMHLAQAKALTNAHGLQSTLEIHYLPYGRQDKEVSNVSTFALHCFAEILNTLKFGEVIIHDPHSEVALKLIQRSEAVYPEKMLEVAKFTAWSDLVCYPDKGAQSKYTKIYSYPYVVGEKIRDQLTGEITSCKIEGDVAGKKIMIVDDICDGGATFVGIATALKRAGAADVTLFVSHGLFTKGLQVLFDAGITRIFTKNGEVVIKDGKIHIRSIRL